MFVLSLLGIDLWFFSGNTSIISSFGANGSNAITNYQNTNAIPATNQNTNVALSTNNQNTQLNRPVAIGRDPYD